MSLQRTYRTPCGLRVIRLSLDAQWNEYLLTCYENGRAVSATYHESIDTAEAEANVLLQQPILPLVQLALI